MGLCFSDSEKVKGKHSNSFCQKAFKTNDFQFVKLIGKGGFSKVWKVMEKKTGKVFAIKVMNKAKIIAKKSVNAVLSERKILSHLSLAGLNFIATIQGSFQDSTKLYLLMDYLQGNNLRHHLNYGVILSETQIRLIIMALVKICQQLYKYKIIHGDLKPENILFDKEGVPFLTDFGAASFFKSDNSEFNSGTLGYMAPQVMLNQSHNYSADYYAIGVMTFELLMKKRPYKGVTSEDLLKQIRKKPVNPQNFPQINTINPEARDFIMKLLQRKPQNRLGYKKGIQQLLGHPWMDSSLDGIDILNELNKINTVFQAQTKEESIVEQSDHSQAQESKTKYEDMLNLDYVQEMFQGFNFIVPSQNINPEKNVRNVRKSSFEMVQRLQSAHNLKRSLKS